jgi:hypothetical protein
MRLLILLLPLAACSPELSSAPLERADRLAVPAVKQYTPAQMKQAAGEMQKHCGTVPMICELVNDYGKMRDQARVALGLSVNTQR